LLGFSAVVDEHNWMELPQKILSTRAVDDYNFQLRLNGTYYPALQELTYIRPFRMVSPAMMPDGMTLCV
jgi:nickel transport system substrate-binding protein